MTAFTIQTNSGSVDVQPIEPKFDHRKMESVLRMRSGAQYRYVWGSYRRAKFSVMLVTSSDQSQLNSFWAENVPAQLNDLNGVAQMSGYLVNQPRPIDQIAAPIESTYSTWD